MNKSSFEALTERLDRLERENRRWKGASTVAAVGIAALVLIGQAGPSKVAPVVEAERFVLRDVNGKARARLFTGPGGAPILGLSDKDGELRAVLTVGADGTPLLGLQDKGEKARAVLTVEAGGPVLSLHDKDEGIRAVLSVSANGVPRLALHHKERKPRALLALGPDGAPHLTLAGIDGNPRIGLGAVAEKHSLIFLDANGKARAGLIVGPEGTPQLLLFDKDEKVIWKAP